MVRVRFSAMQEDSCRKVEMLSSRSTREVNRPGGVGKTLSLQRRLTLFFIVIVVLPLAAAGFVIQRIVVGEVSERAMLALTPALNSAVVTFNERSAVIDERIRVVVDNRRLARLLDEGERGQTNQFLEEALDGAEGVDFLALVDSDGDGRGFAYRSGNFLPGVGLPEEAEVTRGGTVGRGYVRSHIPLRGRGGGELMGGFWLDSSVLQGAAGEAVDLSVAVAGEVIASTADLDGPRTVDVDFARPFDTELDGEARGRARELAPDVSLVATTREDPVTSVSGEVMTWLLLLLALALVGTALIALALARLITRPIEELAQGAQAIAEGRFDHHIPVRSKDEVGRLATVFNNMTDQLSDMFGQVQSSRDMLQRAVQRVGETLRSTHDMKQMLETIVNTAADAVQADAAALWIFTPARDELYPAVARGIEMDDLKRIRVGEGIVGLVAERATTVLIPASEGGPQQSRNEPDFPAVIAIPLYSQDRLLGVLMNYRSDTQRYFTLEDRDSVVFLADQAGVAIENVTLHEEAQRLSLIDGLTGVYNRRYLQMQFRQVLATAIRFERPFSVLMLDLDYFKAINDEYGHQRGDEILVEVAHRVSGVLREVDTFARYGGEEFACLLFETGLPGAVATAEKILDVVRSEQFAGVGEEPLSLTVSAGVASYPEHGDTFQALIGAADKALYRAKQEGRDRVFSADDPSTELKLAR